MVFERRTGVAGLQGEDWSLSSRAEVFTHLASRLLDGRLVDTETTSLWLAPVSFSIPHTSSSLT